jgi:hypothetical protein
MRSFFAFSISLSFLLGIGCGPSKDDISKILSAGLEEGTSSRVEFAIGAPATSGQNVAKGALVAGTGSGMDYDKYEEAVKALEAQKLVAFMGTVSVRNRHWASFIPNDGFFQHRGIRQEGGVYNVVMCECSDVLISVDQITKQENSISVDYTKKKHCETGSLYGVLSPILMKYKREECEGGPSTQDNGTIVQSHGEWVLQYL